MDDLWGHYAKWSKLVTEGHILYDSTYMRNRKWLLPGCLGLRGIEELLINGHKASVMQNELSSRDLQYLIGPMVNNTVLYS